MITFYRLLYIVKGKYLITDMQSHYTEFIQFSLSPGGSIVLRK